MNNKIIDGMRKESAIPRNIMIFAYTLVLSTFGYMYVNNKSFFDKDILTMFLVSFVSGTMCLYGWLYALKYRVEFDDEKVKLKTLFRKIELNICDIEKYTCSRYRKSVFYQFVLYAKDKKVLINTRFVDEFDRILKYNKIEKITK